MTREQIYYAVIGIGLLVIVLVVVWQVWPETSEPLEPPHVLAETLQSSAPKERKVKAARDFVRHGPVAREEVRSALNQHQQHEPEVVEPLVQATMKNRDYRSVPTLIDLLDHPDPQVRGRAGAAITKIIGADMGYRANMPEAERKKMIEAIRFTYQQSLPTLRNHYAEQ